MTRKRLDRYGTLLVYGIGLLLCLFALHGCALFGPCPVDQPAADLAEEYREAREPASDDGPAISESETRGLDKRAGRVEDALEEKARPWSPPTTGIPWVDGALAVGAIATSIFGAHKTVNWSRDRKRRKRGERTDEKPA